MTGNRHYPHHADFLPDADVEEAAPASVYCPSLPTLPKACSRAGTGTGKAGADTN